MKNIRNLIIIFCSLITIYGYAWGSRGHKIVATIAKKSLAKEVVDSVQYYLGNMSFEDASVWVDEMRSNSEYDYLKPWHYINIEKDKTYVKVEKPNVVNQLEQAIADLKLTGKDRTKDKIAFSLKIIFHLVGDLHQPLHDGYSEDKGGNSINVVFNGEDTNLHKVWDTNIIENSNISTNKCLEYLNGLSSKEKSDLQTINVVEWMTQSRNYLGDVYAFEKGKITKEYEQKAVPIIEKQLSAAGVRLASILYNNFKR